MSNKDVGYLNDVINEWSAFHRYGIMYEYKRFWNINEYRYGRTIYLMEVERVE